MSLTEFIQSLYDTLSLPELFSSEEGLRKLWSAPRSRDRLLKRLEESGFSKTDLQQIQTLINAENSDLFDVIETIRFAAAPIPRNVRSQKSIMTLENLTDSERDFIDFLADQYVARGVEELDEPRLELLLEAKYSNVIEGVKALGKVDVAMRLFLGFQRNLYLDRSAYEGAL